MEFFENLPNERGVRDEPINWTTAKEELVKNPGRWGLMAENVSSSTGTQLRMGLNTLFRGGELDKFEFRMRRPGGLKGREYAKRRTDLYGRYTPAEANEEMGGSA